MCDALHDLAYRGVVNAPFMPSVLEPELAPFLKLSDMMGELSSKLCRAEGKRVVQLNLSTFGGRDVDVTQSRVANLLLAAAVKGMLGSEHEPSVNYVNATFQARALGINTQVRDFQGFMYFTYT